MIAHVDDLRPGDIWWAAGGGVKVIHRPTPNGVIFEGGSVLWYRDIDPPRNINFFHTTEVPAELVTSGDRVLLAGASFPENVLLAYPLDSMMTIRTGYRVRHVPRTDPVTILEVR